MSKRCPNIQDILLCDCTEDQCSIREELNCHYSGLASVKSYDMEQDKEEQKRLLTEIMEADARDGLYKQQTAVEYLLSQLPNKHQMRYQLNQKGVIKKAKEMEMEQIMMAFNDGKVNTVLKKRNSEQYYNETYGK